MALANRLREYRKQAGKTSRELADAVGVGHTQIIRIENGKRRASDDLKVALANYFAVPITELFFVEDGAKKAATSNPSVAAAAAS